jgi:hypothetical protein
MKERADLGAAVPKKNPGPAKRSLLGEVAEWMRKTNFATPPYRGNALDYIAYLEHFS